jgi:hypothetical protein
MIAVSGSPRSTRERRCTPTPQNAERGTFQTIEGYPFAQRLRCRTPQSAVVELAVSGGVRDIADHLIDLYQVSAPLPPSDQRRA